MERNRREWAGLAFAVVGFSATTIVLGVHEAIAQGPSEQVAFADTSPLQITTDHWPPDPTALQVVNATSETQSLIGTVSLLPPGQNILLVADEHGRPGAVRVPPFSVETIELITNQASPPPEGKTVTGTIAISASPAGVLIYRALTLTFSPTAGAAEAKPLVDTWAMTAYRTCPWCDRKIFERTLPLAIGVEPAPDGTFLGLKPGDSLGVLVGDAGGGLTLIWPGETRDFNEAAKAIPLQLRGTRQSGSYSGKIDLSPTNKESGVVSLTVIQKDLFVYPLIVLLLGVVLAWRIERFKGVGSKVSKLLEQVNRDKEAISQADEKFRGDVAGKPISVPSIAPMLQQKAAEVESDLTSVRRSFFFVLDEQDQTYRNALSNLQTIEDQTLVWTEFGGKLRALDAVLDKVERTAQTDSAVPPTLDGGPIPRLPTFLQRARELLDPKTPPDKSSVGLSTLPDLQTKVADFTKLADTWLALNKQVHLLRKWVDKLSGRASLPEPNGRAVWDPNELEMIQEARRLLSEAEWDLWYVADSADLLDREAVREVARIEQIVAQLSYRLHRKATENEVFLLFLEDLELQQNELAPPEVAEGSSAWGRLLGNLREPTEPAARAAWLESHRRFWTRAIFYLFLAGAVYLGMQTVYQGKAFGSVLDYVQALTWGIASKITLDAAASALDSVRGSRIPVPLK